MENPRRVSMPTPPVHELHERDYIARERQLDALRSEERELEAFTSRYDSVLSRLQGVQREITSTQQRLNGWRQHVDNDTAERIDQLVREYDAYKVEATSLGEFCSDVLAGGSTDSREIDYREQIDSLRNGEDNQAPLFERQRRSLEGALRLLQREQRDLHRYIAEYDAKWDRLSQVHAQAKALEAYLNGWRNESHNKPNAPVTEMPTRRTPHDEITDEIDEYLRGARPATDMGAEQALRREYANLDDELRGRDQEYTGIGEPPPGEAYRHRLDALSARLQTVRKRLSS